MDATAKCQGRSATRYAPCARPTFNPPISRRRRRRSLRRGPDQGCATSDLFADAPDDALDAAVWIEIAASRVPNSRRGDRFHASRILIELAERAEHPSLHQFSEHRAPVLLSDGVHADGICLSATQLLVAHGLIAQFRE